MFKKKKNKLLFYLLVQKLVLSTEQEDTSWSSACWEYRFGSRSSRVDQSFCFHCKWSPSTLGSMIYLIAW